MDAVAIANAVKEGGVLGLVGLLLWMLYSLVMGREKVRDDIVTRLMETTLRIISALDAQANVLEKMCAAHEIHSAECRVHFSDMGTAAKLIETKLGRGGGG